MSINSAMLAGVSGLISNSSALAAISDNIANANTVGYKRDGIDFSSLVTSGAGLNGYSAGGVAAFSRQFVNQQGTAAGLDQRHRPGHRRRGLLRHHRHGART